MSSEATQLDDAVAANAETQPENPLSQWQARVVAFADSFEAEIDAILTTLSQLTIDEPDTEPEPAPVTVSPPPPADSGGCDRTTEFVLPQAPPDAPLRGANGSDASDPNRLAALKARLSQQMATSGHSHSADGATEENRP